MKKPETKKVVQFKEPLEEATPRHIVHSADCRTRALSILGGPHHREPPQDKHIVPDAQTPPADAKRPASPSSLSPTSPLPPFPPTPGTATPESTNTDSPKWPIAIPNSPSSVESDELDSDDAPDGMVVDPSPSVLVPEVPNQAMEPTPVASGSNTNVAMESLLRHFKPPQSMEFDTDRTVVKSGRNPVRLGESLKGIKEGIDSLAPAKSERKKGVRNLLSRLMEAQMYVGGSIDTLRDCLDKYGLDGQAIPE